MKIFSTPASPYVRKVLVCAHELGLADRIDKLPGVVHPVHRNATIRKSNPIGQVPTFFTDDDMVLYDSRVICEYLNEIGDGQLFGAGAARWRILTDAALGDGLLGAALLARYEDVARPETLRWDAWRASQFEKITDAVDKIDGDAAGFGDRVDIGTITFACGLSYMDFRFPDFDWRTAHPATVAWFARFSERRSMQLTPLTT